VYYIISYARSLSQPPANLHWLVKPRHHPLLLPTMSQTQTVGDVRPDVPLAAENAGWENVLSGLLSVFDHADILMLGEAHGRQVDQPALEPLRTIPAMFRALADATREVNRTLPPPRQVRLVLGGSAGRPAER